VSVEPQRACPFFTGSPRGGEAAAFKRCVGIAPGQNRRQLLLRNGVRRGRNARKAHQRLRSPGDKAGTGNHIAGRRRIGRSSRTESCPPGYQVVRLKEGGFVTAKIIDLGLAKTLGASASEAGISSPGAFAGTPEFASPEQFAGVGVDIRSDLYSLGVTLWEMVTGRTPFQGPSAEVMCQHQHARLPVEQLKNVPQPGVVLLEALLEKDPAQRFQNPTELLQALPKITDAIDTRRRITRQTLEKTLANGRAGTRKPPTNLHRGKFP
jgi:serine/threonine protein kinase